MRIGCERPSGAHLPATPAPRAPDLPRSRATAGTVTVFSTVGFGDISPKSEAAWVVLMVQMLGDLAVLGTGRAGHSSTVIRSGCPGRLR